MEPTIPNPAECEFRAVIRLFDAKGERTIDTFIHSCVKVYGEGRTDTENVRKRCKEFSQSHAGVHDRERSGTPSISDETSMQTFQKH